MLSTLVQRQKHWTIPLMVSLALSWCLLLCNGLVSQAIAADYQQHVVMSTESPPCHGVISEVDVPPTGSIIVDSTHDNCSGCDTPATQLESLSLPAVVLSVSWLQVNELWPTYSHNSDNFVHPSPPRPSVPLYLRKNQLLI
ncbi:hypothetical protein [Arsukibacterium indicum]|uniref:DUF2946 domain-containing protein n=1 Tax=Arsukibacterium indicum TaxID=2848612 RepID=A0ABS6MJL8_9GAMM|nr:hypothetical protein [Arsukibacterium indicum]MBV2128950.1 hypothetical protein [Arsukibacterium indicum]